MTSLRLFFSNQYFHLLLRVLLGATFIVSAQAKLPHHTDFVVLVKDYDVLPDALAGAYANTLPWIELLIGVYLLLGILTRFSAVISFLMGISFLIASIFALSRGDEYCGKCFGELTTLSVNQAITIEVFIVTFSAILIFARPQKQVYELATLFKKSDSESPEAPDEPDDSNTVIC